MVQNKIKNILLLVLVFAVSAAIGYVIAGILFPGAATAVTEVEYTDLEQEVQEDSTLLYQEDTSVFAETEVIEQEEVAEEPAEELKPEPYEYYSTAELETFLNTGDYEQRPVHSKAVFPSNMLLVFTNLQSDDTKPSDLATVCSKISMGQWKAVTVVHADYNYMNQITKVTLEIHYEDSSN